MATHAEFVDTQNGIYAKFRAAHDKIAAGDQPLAFDGGADHKGAYLVAWRFPTDVARRIGALSSTVDGIVGSVVYGPNNAHTTLSDYGLAPGLRIDTQTNEGQRDTMFELSQAVARGLRVAGDTAVRGAGIMFGDFLTNGTTVIGTGTPNEELWTVNEAVKAASAELGVMVGDVPGLKGSWGGHTTVARFVEAEPRPEAGPEVTRLLDTQQPLGLVVPEALEVGSFFVTPDGFDYTAWSRQVLAQRG